MLDELIKELQEKKNNQQVVVIDWVLDKLENINIYFEVAKNEVNTAIEDLYNDDVYDWKDKLEKLSESDINSIAWRVEDMGVFNDVYEAAREEVEEKAKIWEEEEND